MTNAKKLLAAILTVIMVVSLMTCFTFAAAPVFAEDYVSYPSSDKIPELKKTACIVSIKARNKPTGTKLNIDWEGQTWQFTAGVNAFGTFDEACKAADLAARGETPQVILSPGTYPELRVKSSVEVFGANWNDNPNVVNTTDPTQVWQLNSAWKVNPTICNDIVIDGAAAGEISILGMQIAHRFYDSFRPQSSTKTVLKLINTYLYQTDTSTATLELATGRTANMRHFAMSFWNLNSHNTGASAANNIDETHIINLRVGKLDMENNNNRLFDEKVSPTFIVDGFCADYSTVNLLQWSWFKWAPYKNAKVALKNSYIAPFEGKGRGGRYDFCGYYADKSPDAALGEFTEVEITNNIFYNSYESNGTPEIRIFGAEYSKVTYEDNLVINTAATATTPDGVKTDFILWYSEPTGNLTDYASFKNNTFLGYKLDVRLGDSSTKIDMTGCYISPTWSSNYKNEQNNVLPTGNVGYEYCYIDGARTIKTDAVQKFEVKDMTVDHDAAMVTGTVGANLFYKTVQIIGQAVCDIYPSDKDYSNIDTYENETPVSQCVLKNIDNYFVFVAFSPDRANRKVYKMKISRPSTPAVALKDIGADVEVIDAVSFEKEIGADDDTFSFTPSVEDGILVSVVPEGSDEPIIPDDNGTYTITDIQKGVDLIYNINLTKGGLTERYSLTVKRAMSSACELVAIDEKLTAVNGGFTAPVTNGQAKFEFTASFSEGATGFVTLGTAVYPYNAGKFVIENPKGAEYKLTVVAEDGTVKNFKLVLASQKSSEAKVLSVANATAKGGGFVAEAETTFTVKPTVSAGAGYKVFSDAACTKLVANNVVTLADKDATVYIVVTAEDGTVAAPVALTIKKKAAGQQQPKPDKPADVEIKDTSKLFTDINAKGWYKEYVDYSVAYGIFTGTGNNKFSPSTNITRAQFVQVLANLVGVDTSNRNVTTSFKDVPAKKWYTAAVKWASDNKIVNGLGDGKFGPDANVTREQMCVMLVNFAKFKGVTLKTVETKENFADNNKISSWAKDAVYACQMADIVNGKGKSTFDPKGTGTRAEASVMFAKFHKEYLAK